MTISISDNTPRREYDVSAGDTVNSFTVPFEFFAASDLSVFVDNVLKTITTHYTVSGGNGSTGTVTMSVTGISGGSKVVITRDIELERTTDFPTQGAFNITSLNTELDKFIAINADLNDLASRGIRLQDSDPAVSMELPLKASRLGKVLAFNATTGAAEAGPTMSDIASVNAISTDIATLADLQDGTTATNALSTLAGIQANITTVAGIASNVTSVAGVASLITADFVADLNTLATTDIVADLNILATSDIVADMAQLATTDFVNDLNAIEAVKTNVTTVATNIDNVNTLAADMATIGTKASVDQAVSFAIALG
tara:strand:+ start:149 stop:1090 length:942 start_codon:yes stop_codon:yes gene_type:complete